MKSWSQVALLSLLVSTSACSESSTIDGTSKETFAKSVAAMADGLPSADKEVFQKGLLNLIVTKYPPAAGVEGLQILILMPQAMEVAHVTLNGYTRDQIMEHGRKLATAGLSATKNDDRDKVVACLQRYVTISAARIEKGDFGYYIKLNVTNKLTWPVSFVHVHYVTSTPGRSVPWSDATFGMNISGGIEPGETKEVSTNAFGIPKEATNIATTAEILDVADPQHRQLVGKVKYVNNAKELTARKCE